MSSDGFCPAGYATPPQRVLSGVERAAPGFWRAFQAALNTGWRSAGPLRLSSWYRDPSRNRACGGANLSQHLIGTAFDVVPSDPGRAIRAFQAAGFTTVWEGDHLHVQVWPAVAAVQELVRRVA